MENDLISRHGVSAWLANMGYSKLADVVMDEDRFPSAQPEKRTEERTEKHACDCISRRAVIDALRTHERKPSKKWFDNQLDIEWNNAIDICCYDIEDLPSAQPKSYREGYQAGYKDAQSEIAERTAKTEQNVSDGDLISRKAAIDALVKDCKASDEGMLNMYDIVCDLKDVPSAQPERQKGEWIDYTEDGYVECPFCHNATNCDGNKDELHFCFSCGADMRGEQDG